MKSGVTDDRKEWDRVRELFRGISDAYVSVGLHSDAEPYERGQGAAANVAQIASFHEFGTARIPARPFFRPTIDGNRAKYADIIRKVTGKLLDGKMKLAQGLTLIGMQVQADVRQAIVDLKDPPLAESTLKAKARKARGTFAAYARKAGLKGKEAAADAKRREDEYVASGANPLIDTGHMRQSVTYKVTIKGKGE
uniref:Tail protein n=2 Tax=viral metagenome TaxID=1070528 RepID=A0A6H1ZN28_9ZZZZ